jgi:glycine cleavage system H protein
MTVILVLGTFVVFIILDYVLNQKKAVQTVPAAAMEGAPAAAGEFVTGFHTPDNLAYHPGHSWLMQERKNMVRMGADEFAAALAGNVEKIELPKPGQWVRQGQKVLALFRNGEKVEMVSPTEGEVMAVNEQVLQNPALLREDPYGKGWLVAIHVPDEESGYRSNGCMQSSPYSRERSRRTAACPPETCWPKCQVRTGKKPPASSS